MEGGSGHSRMEKLWQAPPAPTLAQALSPYTAVTCCPTAPASVHLFFPPSNCSFLEDCFLLLLLKVNAQAQRQGTALPSRNHHSERNPLFRTIPSTLFPLTFPNSCTSHQCRLYFVPSYTSINPEWHFNSWTDVEPCIEIPGASNFKQNYVLCLNREEIICSTCLCAELKKWRFLFSLPLSYTHFIENLLSQEISAWFAFLILDCFSSKQQSIFISLVFCSSSVGN